MAEKLSAQCHCGAVAFTVELSDGFNTVRRCNCSYAGCVGRSRSPRRFQESMLSADGISSRSIVLIPVKPCTFSAQCVGSILFINGVQTRSSMA